MSSITKNISSNLEGEREREIIDYGDANLNEIFKNQEQEIKNKI